jgi:hypothetical protein
MVPFVNCCNKASFAWRKKVASIGKFLTLACSLLVSCTQFADAYHDSFPHCLTIDSVLARIEVTKIPQRNLNGRQWDEDGSLPDIEICAYSPPSSVKTCAKRCDDDNTCIGEIYVRPWNTLIIDVSDRDLGYRQSIYKEVWIDPPAFCLSRDGCVTQVVDSEIKGVAPMKFNLTPSKLVHSTYCPSPKYTLKWDGCNDLSFATIDRALEIIWQTKWGARSLVQAMTNGTTLEVMCGTQGLGQYLPYENTIQIPVQVFPQNSTEAREQIAELVRTLLEEVAHAVYDKELMKKTSKQPRDLTWPNPKDSRTWSNPKKNRIPKTQNDCNGFVKEHTEKLLRYEALGQLQAALVSFNLNNSGKPIEKNWPLIKASNPKLKVPNPKIQEMFKVGGRAEQRFIANWGVIKGHIGQNKWPDAVEEFVKIVKLERSSYGNYEQYFKRVAENLLKCPEKNLEETDRAGWVCTCEVDSSPNNCSPGAPMRTCP